MPKFKEGDKLNFRDFPDVIWIVMKLIDNNYVLSREIPSGLDDRFDTKTRNQHYVDFSYELTKK